MKAHTILLGLLVLTVAAAGCTQPAAVAPPPAPPPEPAPTTSAPPPTTEAPPPTTPAPPPPPPKPEKVFTQTFKWAASNDGAQSFAVKNGTTKLEVKILINATGPGAYNIAGPGTPPSGKASVTLQGPGAGNTTVKQVSSTSGVYGSGSHVVEDIPTYWVLVPPKGDWTMSIAGSGTNIQADVVIVAHYD